jgi:hypothetical protein
VIIFRSQTLFFPAPKSFHELERLRSGPTVMDPDSGEAPLVIHLREGTDGKDRLPRSRPLSSASSCLKAISNGVRKGRRLPLCLPGPEGEEEEGKEMKERLSFHGLLREGDSR